MPTRTDKHGADIDYIINEALKAETVASGVTGVTDTGATEVDLPNQTDVGSQLVAYVSPANNSVDWEQARSATGVFGTYSYYRWALVWDTAKGHWVLQLDHGNGGTENFNYRVVKPGGA